MKKTIFIIFILLSFGGSASAATDRIYLEGPREPIAPGSVFSVRVYIDASEPLNTLDVTLKYSQNELASLGFNNNSSQVTLWPESPKAEDGEITFAGGFIPAFEDSRGEVIRLEFKALKAGTPEITFTKSDFYKADGKGTLVEATSSGFSLEVNDEGKVLSENIVAFQEPVANVEIAKELEALRSRESWKRTYTYGIAALIVLFVGILLYNKRRRKI